MEYNIKQTVKNFWPLQNFSQSN